MRIAFTAAFLAGLLICCNASAVELSDSTRLAYDEYVARTDAAFQEQHTSAGSFLRFDHSRSQDQVGAEERLRRGEVLIDRVEAHPIPGGLIHHWRGTAFLPGASLATTLATVQNYDAFATNYQPEVLRSSLISRHGNDFRFAMRLRKHKVITVVLDTLSSVHFAQLDADHHFSISHMTRIAEVANAGAPSEHTLVPGSDNGFLWRMETYWSYVQSPGGVFVQCESVSLTRDIPFGLKYIVGPFIESVPRESLDFTLRTTRDAVLRAAAMEPKQEGNAK